LYAFAGMNAHHRGTDRVDDSGDRLGVGVEQHGVFLHVGRGRVFLQFNVIGGVIVFDQFQSASCEMFHAYASCTVSQDSGVIEKWYLRVM
jgi:hypothetical protein